MKTDIYTIRQTLEQEKAYLAKTYGITDLGIFGSVARGDNTSASDIDILVTFARPIGMFQFIAIEEYLSERLGKKVDLVTTKALKPTIKDEVLSQLIYV